MLSLAIVNLIGGFSNLIFLFSILKSVSKQTPLSSQSSASPLSLKVVVASLQIQRQLLQSKLEQSFGLKSLKGKEIKVWFFAGEAAAKLMGKLAETHIDEAFELAWVLVDAWEATDEYKLKDMVAKFEEHEYEELIFKYYNKLFEVDAFKATAF